LSQRFDEARRVMVQEILAQSGINDSRVLQAMLILERHRFVDGPMQSHAYDNRALPIGVGQTISQPLIVAKMTQALQLQGPERILEIGTGSGYQAAVLSLLCQKVYTIERHDVLLKRAREIFLELGLTQVISRRGDGSIGWPAEGPFDGILVTAGAPSVPRALCMQLKIGGRLVIPVGDRAEQDLKIIHRRSESDFEGASAGACAFVPLIGTEGFDL
jgi:protein-L-isoaspartate(D-aspartate) O-methyltransferase